jgi:hypothetical protein
MTALRMSQLLSDVRHGSQAVLPRGRRGEWEVPGDPSGHRSNPPRVLVRAAAPEDHSEREVPGIANVDDRQ